MKEELELLISGYKLKLKAVESLLESWEAPSNKEKVKAKISCYKAFILELENLKDKNAIGI